MLQNQFRYTGTAEGWNKLSDKEKREAFEVLTVDFDSKRINWTDSSKENGIIVITTTQKPFNSLSCNEREAFMHNNAVLHNRQRCLVLPESVSYQEYLDYDGALHIVQLPDRCLKNILSYCNTVCNPAYWSIFRSYRWALTCHVDAWIFEDRLQTFMDYGYDYYGAPWWLSSSLMGNAGNDGFMLCKPSKMYEIFSHDREKLKSDAEFREYYEKMPSDIRACTIARGTFNIAPVLVCLEFSWEQKPDLDYTIMQGKLPMGCHSYCKYENGTFWKKYIPILDESVISSFNVQH